LCWDLEERIGQNEEGKKSGGRRQNVGKEFFSMEVQEICLMTLLNSYQAL
jgi:hypothetical protein